MKNYILDEFGNPVEEPDIVKWAEWSRKADRHVAKDQIDDVRVSTVFLGSDHSFGGGRPMLYETMIFGGENDGFQERYSNAVAALAGHDQAVASVRASAT